MNESDIHDLERFASAINATIRIMVQREQPIVFTSRHSQTMLMLKATLDDLYQEPSAHFGSADEDEPIALTSVVKPALHDLTEKVAVRAVADALQPQEPQANDDAAASPHVSQAA